MRNARQPARINVKALVILASAVVLLAGGAAVGYKVRKRIMANRALVAGNAALEKEDWAEACKHLKLYLSKYPGDEKTLARYAEANLAVRPRGATHVRAALGAYRRLLRAKPGDDQICETLAKLYLQYGNLNEATYICQQRLDADPRDPDAALVLGQALIAQRKGDTAADVLGKLVAEHPDQVKAYGLLSTVAMQEESVSATDAASQWLDRAVEANPQSAEARAQRAGFRRIVWNDVDAAREDLEVAQTLLIDDPSLRLRLAEEWMSLRDLDRAKAQVDLLEHIDATALAAYDGDPDDLTLAVFLTRGRLLLLGGAEEGSGDLANLALAELPDRQRTAFLPLAIQLYVAANDGDHARRCLDEYRGKVEEAGAEDSARRDGLSFLAAMVAMVEGKPYDGINELEPLLARAPGHARAWRLLVTAYDRTGQRLRAIEASKEYLERAAGDFAMTLSLAKACLRARDLDEALRYAGKAERLKPDHLDARLLRIEIEIDAVEAGSMDNTKLADVLQELATLPESASEVGRVAILRAWIAAQEGRTDDAVAELEQALVDAGENNLKVATNLIRLYRSLGRQEEASELCRRAVAIRPDLAEPRIVLAQLHVEAGRPADAHDTLKAAVADLADRERLEAQVSLAQFALLHRDRGEGVSLLQELAAEHTDHAQLRVVLLSLPEVHDDLPQCQGFIDELRIIEGERGLRWRVEQAKLWLRGEEWSQRRPEIEEMLTHCLTADPGWAQPVVLLGIMYEMLGKEEQAEEIYRQAIDSHPGHIAAATRLLKLLERQRRFADADSVLERMPADLSALGAFRVDAAVRRGEFDSAIEEMQRQIAVGPDDGASRVVLAKLTYAHRKDVDAAFDLLKEAESLGADLLAVSSTRVEILHAEGRGQEALELLNADVERREDFAAYLLRAQYYSATDRPDLAERDYTHLTTLPESSVDGFRLLGNFYYGDRKTAKAIAAWDAGLEVDPEHPGLRRALAKALLISPEPQEQRRGLTMLDDLSRQLPEDADLLAVRAGVLIDEQTPAASQEASTLLERVVRRHPRNVAAHLQLVKLAHQRGDLEQTRALLVQALGANPKNAELTLAHAMLEVERNNLRPARELAQYVIELDPENVPARNLLGNLALSAGDTELALRFNNEALALAPTDVSAHLARATILDMKGMGDEAIQSLESYRRTDAGRDSVAPLLALARRYRWRGDFATAQQRLADAAQLAPANSTVFIERLTWLAAQDRFDELLNELAARRAKYPGEPQVLLASGELLAATGVQDYLRQARSLFVDVTAQDPDHVQAHLGLAQVAYRAGELDQSQQAYRRVLSIEPYHRQALNDLAWILGVDQGKPEEALEWADKGVARYPADPHLLDTRAVLLTSLDDLAAAQQDLEDCLKAPTNTPLTRARALLHLARVHVGQGEFAAATGRLNEALAVDRQHSVLSEDELAEIDRLLKSSSASPDKHPDTQ